MNKISKNKIKKSQKDQKDDLNYNKLNSYKV